MLNASHGPKAHTLAAPTTTVDVNLSHARNWRARLTNTHGAVDITSVTAAFSPLGSGFGPPSASLGAIAHGDSIDVSGENECAKTLRLTFAVGGAGEVTIEMAGV